MITRVAIQNYRLFEDFSLDFEPGMNIVVGDNDSGKSTLIEAINLALTGRIAGRWLAQDFSPFLVNQNATTKFIEAIKASPENPPEPPEVVIDLYLEDSEETEILRGSNNLSGENACGIRVRGYLSPDYLEEYKAFVSGSKDMTLVPTEYFTVEWLGFSGNGVTARSIPASASVIDPATIRMQTGTDYHLQQIIRTHLDPRERVELSREYRSLREQFVDRDAVKEVNKKLAGEKGSLTDREFSLSIDLSQRFTWEQSLAAHLDDLPFTFVGKGEQNAVKTLLAIGRKAEDAHVVLIEEPENHLSFSSLRKLLTKVEERCEGKQVIVATHSSFVLNKLGLDKLILLGKATSTRITGLPADTANYFRKLPGYDTLRVALAKSVILVEGPSDELVVQRAYFDAHQKLPIDDGVDVISVRGLSFRRFLELAVSLGKGVTVVRDNDGNEPEVVRASYAAFADLENVSICVGDDPALDTLEPQLAAVNDLAHMNQVLGKDFQSVAELVDYMKRNKTQSALAVFDSAEPITMPEYIRGAVA